MKNNTLIIFLYSSDCNCNSTNITRLKKKCWIVWELFQIWKTIPGHTAGYVLKTKLEPKTKLITNWPLPNLLHFWLLWELKFITAALQREADHSTYRQRNGLQDLLSSLGFQETNQEEPWVAAALLCLLVPLPRLILALSFCYIYISISSPLLQLQSEVSVFSAYDFRLSFRSVLSGSHVPMPWSTSNSAVQ